MVLVGFFTRLPPKFHVDTVAFVVPSNFGRYDLSTLVNTLLGLEEPPPQPFDCLLNGELLRTSIEQFLFTRRISPVEVLRMEYILLVLPPELHQSVPHDDWVTAVSGFNRGFYATGSYDNHGRIWNAAGKCVFLLKGHMDVITSVAPIPAPGSSSEQVQLVTASKDRSLCFWQVALNEGTSTTSTVKATKRVKAHTASIMCVAASPSGSQVCSGAWDNLIKLWTLGDEPKAEEHVGGKKRRSKTGAVNSSDKQVEPTATLQGHTHTVGGLDWAERDTIYSASSDRSVRAWDVETAINTQTLTSSIALFCLSVGGEGSALPAAGGADHRLRIWDPRLPGSVAPVLQLSSHTSWIVACKWHPKSNFHILTASYDGTVKLWDTRAIIPLFTLSQHKDRVMCADWWMDESIISGDVDSQLHVYRDLKIPF